MSEKREKTGKPLNAKTVNLDLTVLNLICTSAKREGLIDSNPCESMERPKMTRRRWRILEPVEVGGSPGRSATSVPGQCSSC